VAGLLIDAGPVESPVLMRVGKPGSRANHAQDPITVSDVFFRVGGAGVGRAKVNLEIDANDALVDHTWIWRADHGAGVGWTANTSANGLVVNGDRVTIYGLFVEIISSFRCFGTAMRAARTSISRRFLRSAQPGSYTSTAGPTAGLRTKWLTA